MPKAFYSLFLVVSFAMTLGCGGQEKVNFKEAQQFLAVDFNNEGTILAGIGKNGAIILWDAIKQAKIKTLESKDRKASSLDFNKDGSLLAVGQDGGQVQILSMPEGEEKQALKSGTSTIKALAFSPDGKNIAIASKQAIEIWSTANFKKTSSLPKSGQMQELAWTPDSKSILAGGSDFNLHVFSIDGTSQSIIKGHIKAISALAVSKDGKKAASGDRAGKILLWDWGAKNPVSTEITAHQGGVDSLSFSSDASILASAGRDDLVKTWSTSNSENLQTFKGHKNDVRGVVFAPDGKSIASAGLDGTVKIWEVK
ncbi:MAG: WD40 repeat domain-containing protein [Planctomycetota bacterium]|nr:MAG: WD40 repeat domain-containing protein [Planctomycetota bacterium]